MVALDFSSDVAVGFAPPVSRHGDRTVVWLDGEQDVATASVLTDTLMTAIAAEDADLIVDLSGVTFIGAATLGVLMSGRNMLRQQSRLMTLRSPSRCARRLLQVSGLTHLIEHDGDLFAD